MNASRARGTPRIANRLLRRVRDYAEVRGDGTITVDSGVQVTFLKIPVSATIKPVVDGGKVHFEVEKASALMFGIPSDFAQQIVDQVSSSLFGPFFNEVNIKELKVTDQGVDFAVDGSDVQLTGEVTGGDTAQCR